MGCGVTWVSSASHCAFPASPHKSLHYIPDENQRVHFTDEETESWESLMTCTEVTEGNNGAVSIYSQSWWGEE